MKPFVSSDQNLKEFSLRAVLIGLVLCIVLGAANARKHQQMRRTESARRQDDFPLGPDLQRPAALTVLDPHRALSIKQDAGRLCPGDDGQVRAIHRRV